MTPEDMKKAALVVLRSDHVHVLCPPSVTSAQEEDMAVYFLAGLILKRAEDLAGDDVDPVTALEETGARFIRRLGDLLEAAAEDAPSRGSGDR